MKRLFGWKYARAAMAAVMLLAIAPNALFLEHYSIGSAEEPQTIVEQDADEHAHHAPAGARAATADATTDVGGTHCHVGPESCSASSGLSNAVVIAVALSLFLLGGGLMALHGKIDSVTLFDFGRRLIVPPRLNLRAA